MTASRGNSVKITLSLLVALLHVSVPTAKADITEGHENGNAGDIYAIEFKLTARDIVQRLRLLSPDDIQGINLTQLSGAILVTKVSSEERVYLNGYEVNAKNLPADGRIVINRSWWRPLRMASETKNRVRLVLHEYLPLIGVPDEGALVSERLIALLDIKNFDPNRWWNPLNPANHITLTLEAGPQGCYLPTIKPNPAVSQEDFSVETTGTCGNYYRKVVVAKASFNAPPSTGYRGTVHRYSIAVIDRDAKVLGVTHYTPRIAECLSLEDGTCALGGSLNPGDASVSVQFWLLREQAR